MIDFDLSGLDEASAREYAVAYITTIKKIERDENKLIEELSLWERREKLAEEKDRPDLQAEAKVIIDEKRNSLYRLRAEKRQMQLDLIDVKRKLKELKNSPKLSIDPELLLQQLETVVGPKDELSDQIKEADIQRELDELKKKIQGENPRE